MARPKKAVKYRCCYSHFESIKVGGLVIGQDFEIPKDLKNPEQFKKMLDSAIKRGMVCPL